MNYFFTADEHYQHSNIIKYAQRPFANLYEMEEVLIQNHNELVRQTDLTIHVGDFCFLNQYRKVVDNYIGRLNGAHLFIKGSHDYFLKDKENYQIWKSTIAGQYVVACHYPLALWPKSHYNSWQLHGHTHGRYETVGKVLDVGVDTNNFYPYSWEDVVCIMKKKQDNKEENHD